MSVQAMSWVIQNSTHKGNSLVVLLMIANHAKSDGTDAWPSVKTLAREARVSSRTIQYTIRRLKKSGELNIQEGAGPAGANLYSLPKMGAQNLRTVPHSSTQANCIGGAQTAAEGGATTIAPEPSFDTTVINLQRRAVPRTPERTSRKETDARCPRYTELIIQCYRFLNNREDPPFDASDTKQLSLVLKACPSLTEEKFRRMLENYANSENINPAARPREFLPKITSYSAGPLDKYGRPKAREVPERALSPRDKLRAQLGESGSTGRLYQ